LIPFLILRVINAAIDTVVRAGGKVTHRFKKLIKCVRFVGEWLANTSRGFSADIPQNALTVFSTSPDAQEWGFLMEEDSVVGILGQD
jgi:hypothetical protein